MDASLLSFAHRFLSAREHACGAKHKVRVRSGHWPVGGVAPEYGIVVCGAHMSGMALNHQLLERGAKLLRKTRTAPVYRFYALGGGGVARPGLVRTSSGGASIEVEVWSLPAERWGDFIDGIPAPLGIGSVELKDGSRVKGFLCEALAVETTPGTREITHLRSWRKL
jgi:allophanate hydrolase